MPPILPTHALHHRDTEIGALHGQQRAVSHPELRPHHLTAQDRQLVPHHWQLDVFARDQISMLRGHCWT